VPNCPVCHQTLSLAARSPRGKRISTVVMGCAKDNRRTGLACRVSFFSDFPLGNSAGRPKDPDSQTRTLELALRVLESAPGPRTTVQSPLRGQRAPIGNATTATSNRLSAEEVERRRAAFEKAKAQARRVKEREARG